MSTFFPSNHKIILFSILLTPLGLQSLLLRSHLTLDTYAINQRMILIILISISYRRLNLYSTSVSIKPLTRLLKSCHTLEYLNLASCRGLPRGIKRLYNNRDVIVQLRNDIADGKFKDCDNDDDDD